MLDRTAEELKGVELPQLAVLVLEQCASFAEVERREVRFRCSWLAADTPKAVMQWRQGSDSEAVASRLLDGSPESMLGQSQGHLENVMRLYTNEHEALQEDRRELTKFLLRRVSELESLLDEKNKRLRALGDTEAELIQAAFAADVESRERRANIFEKLILPRLMNMADEHTKRLGASAPAGNLADKPKEAAADQHSSGSAEPAAK
jgi:hypothetical protein